MNLLKLQIADLGRAVRGAPSTGGTLRQQLIEAVRNQPGITTESLAKQFGITTQTVWGCLSHPQKQGRLIRKDRAWHYPEPSAPKPRTRATRKPQTQEPAPC